MRIDTGVEQGDTISPKFDSMMGKVIVTAQNRLDAVARVRRVLDELVIEGVPTPIPLFKEIFRNDDFTAENGHPFSVSTKWLERTYLNRTPASASSGQPASLAGAAAPAAPDKSTSETFVIEMNNRRVKLTVPLDIVENITGSARARGAKRPTQPLRGAGLHNVPPAPPRRTMAPNPASSRPRCRPWSRASTCPKVSRWPRATCWWCSNP